MVPSTSSLTSMLPPYAAGGTECGRSSDAVATPIVPRNGASGNVTVRAPPSTTGSVPHRAPSRSSTGANTLTVEPDRGSSPGRAPLPCRLEITPYGTRGCSRTTVMASRSPGRAPSTRIGPVTMCGPSRTGSRRLCAAISIASRSTASPGTPWLPKNAAGSPPWSGSVPSWLTVSITIVSPDAIVSTGASVRQGRRPHSTVAGSADRYVASSGTPSPGCRIGSGAKAGSAEPRP